MKKEEREYYQIRELIDRFTAALCHGRLDELSSIWEEDAQLFAPQSPALIGLKDIVFGNREWLTQWEHDIRVECNEITIAGLSAFICGRVSVRSTSQKTASTSYADGKFIAIMKRGGNHEWKIYRLCYNSNVPPIQLHNDTI